ncbi:hypothetical protein [Mycobacterium sp. NPDC004974]
MPLALRPYVTAGVALVGAGIIAVTPVAAPPPAVQTHAVQLSAAIDNPIEVFAPVFTQAGTVVQNAIQAELNNPFPVTRAIIDKAAADGKALGDMATALAPVVQNLVKYFPVTTEVAMKRLAEGDLDGALGTYIGLFFGPVWVGFMQYMKVVGLVEDKFEIAKRVTSAAMYYAWGMISVAASGFGFAQTVAANIEAVGKSIATGDPTNVVNAVQHGIANVASAAINQADYLKLVLDPRPALAAAINPPPPDPEEEFLTATTDRQVAAVSLPATPAPSVEVPPAEPTTEDVATGVDAPGEATPAAETPTTETRSLVRDSLVAVPGKPGITSTTKKSAAKFVSEVRDGISTTVNKIGEDVKKALAKPEKKSTSASAHADKASDAG